MPIAVQLIESEVVSSDNYAENGIYVPSLLIYLDHITFLIKNTYKTAKTVHWEVTEKSDSQTIIDSDTITVEGNSYSTTQKVEGLIPDTKYVLSVTWGSGAVEEDLIKNFTTKSESSESTTQGNLTITNSGNFNFLYDTIGWVGNSPVNVTGYGITATKIGLLNLYYLSRYSSAAGLNDCRPVSYWGLFSIFAGTVIPNCVGYAHGRVKEIWGRCKSNKIIKGDDSSGYVVAENNRAINGYINMSWGSQPCLPACDAEDWWDMWPTSSGWGKSSSPVLGAVMCWGGHGAGHVAVVEEVNYATGDVIVSESHYGSDSLKARITKYYKSNNYSLGEGYTFKGFLISPVCQITGSLGANFQPEVIITLNQIDVGDTDQATYNEIAHAHQIKLNESLNINDKVEIQWFGNTKSDGTGKNVGNLTLVGLITNINRSADYPYEVTVAGKIAGYYQRDALIKTSAQLSSSVYSITDNILTNNSILFSAIVNVDDLRIRSDASVNSTALGFVKKGQKVNVYQVKSNGGYNWYKIDKSYDKWIANTQNRNDPEYPWVSTISPEQTGVSDYLYKAKVMTQVHVRYDHSVESLIVPPSLKNAGDIVNVYEEWPESGYDSDGYFWRRIGQNQWVADINRAGSWLVNTNQTPSSQASAIGTLTVSPGVELKRRTSPGIANNDTGRRVTGTLPSGTTLDYYKVSKNVDGCDWYYVEILDDYGDNFDWIGNKWDSSLNDGIGGYYIINIRSKK